MERIGIKPQTFYFPSTFLPDHYSVFLIHNALQVEREYLKKEAGQSRTIKLQNFQGTTVTEQGRKICHMSLHYCDKKFWHKNTVYKDESELVPQIEKAQVGTSNVNFLQICR